jgi:hypothetical protein
MTCEEFQQFVIEELTDINRKIDEIEEVIVTKQTMDHLLKNQDLLQVNQESFDVLLKEESDDLLWLSAILFLEIKGQVDAIFCEHEARRRQKKVLKKVRISPHI